MLYVLVEVEKRLKRWKEYTEELFSDKRSNSTEISEYTDEERPEITKSKLIHALKPHKVHGEMLKILAEQESEGNDQILSLFNMIHNTGCWKYTIRLGEIDFCDTSKKA